ncbi:MAG: glutamate--tRNA ligase [Paracoccaceae bacterium]|nr:glutamate--tRNA ligase [Paracoccaceae bacterium]
MVVTRFAPSPTGYLHIGSARTALFNWLFARHHGGTFLLRVEDTDRNRYTPEATQAIYDGLKWLGLDWDAEPTSQFEGRERHAAVAAEMLKRGTAYKCFATQDEIEAFRESARENGTSTLYQSPWRDCDPADHLDAPFVVRLKAPTEGETIVRDVVQGEVTYKNANLDDMVLLRSDGTPTYMLAVVVDDHDMGVTHVIRGDDHLNNTPRQTLIYQAMGWDLPVFAHIPLIHGPDGKKLSKRHGAMGAHEYQALGYIAAGMRNYLARLGWSHGDDEFFTTEQAIEWFGLDGIGKSPSRFDFKKLDHINGQHVAGAEKSDLLTDISAFLAITDQNPLSDAQLTGLNLALPFIQERAKTLPDLIEKAEFILASRPIVPDEKAAKHLDTVSHGVLKQLTPHLQNVTWSRETLEAALNGVAEENDIKFGKMAGPLRAALAGRTQTPSVFDMMLVLGREETLARIADVAV